jgi:hypothetical protein
MDERHLVLEAPNPVARRALLDALKASRSHVRIHLHLSPLGRANKTLVYYLAKKNMVNIIDHGDLVHICWKKDETINVNIDLLRSAEEVQDRLHKFFGTRPKNLQRPIPKRPPPHTQQVQIPQQNNMPDRTHMTQQ